MELTCKCNEHGLDCFDLGQAQVTDSWEDGNELVACEKSGIS
jgi:hypothetical protein